MAISVKDRVAIITGGAGELGSVLARRLVDEGAVVVIAVVLWLLQAFGVIGSLNTVHVR